VAEISEASSGKKIDNYENEEAHLKRRTFLQFRQQDQA